jgi:hypothetical protein
MNTGHVTPGSLRKRWIEGAGYAGAALFAGYGVWVLAIELPVLTLFLVVAGVVALDGLLLLLAAKRRSVGVAIRCGMVALLAALVQAFWVYIPFRWDVLAPDSDGVLWFVSALALAVILAGGLLVRRESRAYGWAVLMGSTQGFVASFVVLVATLAAAIGPD